MLYSIPARRWVFTNSDIDHAERVLARLGIDDCFEGIVDIWAMEPHCKPQPEAYQTALALSKTTDPKTCVFLDDSVQNLVAARKLGFFTVLVGKNGHDDTVDRSLERLEDLPAVMPELWGRDER